MPVKTCCNLLKEFILFFIASLDFDDLKIMYCTILI